MNDRSIEIFKMMNNKYDFGYSSDDIDFMYKSNFTLMKLMIIIDIYIKLFLIKMVLIQIEWIICRDLKMTGIENRYNIDYNSMLYIMNNSIIYENFGCKDIFYKEDTKYF